MPDRRYSPDEVQDRFAIEDLYDRQLAAAEAFDFEAYDTTFAADARIDLSDFGRAECGYAEYRAWLDSLRSTMVAAQRIAGGLRLSLEGARATTRVPVACHVTMQVGGERRLTHTGVFYNDVLERRRLSCCFLDRNRGKAPHLECDCPFVEPRDELSA